MKDISTFAEEYCPDVHLHDWQKEILKTMMDNKDREIYICLPKANGRSLLLDIKLEYMKFMKLDFALWKKDGIEIYEKGKFVIKEKDQ